MRNIIQIIWCKTQGSDIGRRMVSGALWSFTGTAFAKLIVLISGIFCARILGKVEYGELGMVRSTINMFVVVGFAGIGITAAKYISEYRKNEKAKICSIYILTNGFAFLMGIIITSVVVLCAPYLAGSFLNAPQLVDDLRFGSVLLFVTIINGSQNGTLVGFENFRAIALNTLMGSIAEAILMLIGAIYWGVLGAILGYGCGFFVLYICNQISIKKTFKRENIIIRNSFFDKKDLRILYKFSLPAALSSLMVAPVFWIIRSIVVRSSGFEELAVFEAAEQWRVVILFIPNALSQIILPILTSTVADHAKFWSVLKVNLYLNISVSLLISLIVAASSVYIMNLYGDNYSDYWTLILLAFSTIPTVFASIVGVAISSRSRMWIGFLFNLLWAIIFIVLSYVFVQNNMGSKGISLSLFMAYTIHSILLFVYLLLINK